jgi:hypothetical protein
MLDIPSISAVVAAVGVTVGVFFAYLEVRNLRKQRQTDLVMRLYSTFGSREFQEAWMKFMTTEFEDYNDYLKKGGVYAPELRLIYEGIGVLLRRKLLDISLVDDLFSGPIMVTWEKWKPLAEGARKHYNRPQFAEWFEYLYNEMQKREQRLQQIQQ